MPIPSSETDAAQTKLASLARCHFFQTLAQDPRVETRNRFSDSDLLAFADALARRGHRALGRAVPVDQESTPRPSIGDVGRKRLATHVHKRQLRQLRLGILAAHRPEQSRRRTQNTY